MGWGGSKNFVHRKRTPVESLDTVYFTLDLGRGHGTLPNETCNRGVRRFTYNELGKRKAEDPWPISGVFEEVGGPCLYRRCSITLPGTHVSLHNPRHKGLTAKARTRWLAVARASCGDSKVVSLSRVTKVAGPPLFRRLPEPAEDSAGSQAGSGYVRVAVREAGAVDTDTAKSRTR